MGEGHIVRKKGQGTDGKGIGQGHITIRNVGQSHIGRAVGPDQTEATFCKDIEPGLKVIKLEYSLRLKIKRNDWLLADTCLQAANHCASF